MYIYYLRHEFHINVLNVVKAAELCFLWLRYQPLAKDLTHSVDKGEQTH